MPDQIVISKLKLRTRVGATTAERAKPQRVLANLVLEPAKGFARIGDRLGRTVDYDAAARAVTRLAASGQRALIETLAEEIAAMLLATFPLAAVELELRKFVLTDTEFVGVRIRRARAATRKGARARRRALR
jgi:dihydroneopterin aldolase